MASNSSQDFDIVLVGATGFTGGLVATYLANHAPASLRWAIAGRNAERLATVAAGLTGIHPPDGELVVDVDRPETVDALVERTGLVATTVGPYLEHGEPLVAACAASGTDYLDITGEPEFVDRMYLRYHEQATDTGARLVHCCGFDSIPHDLGAYFTVQQLPDDAPITLDGYVRAGGRPSGGTFHSAVNVFSRLRQARTAARDRRAAEPDTGARQARAATPLPGHRDGWTLPMPTIDPEIVVRSAQALEAYGPDFTYRHHVEVERLPTAAAMALGMPTLVGIAQFAPTRNLLLRQLAQGEGPTVEQRAKGWFEVTFVGRSGDRTVRTQVRGGDPGYTETAKMLAETAMSLVEDDHAPLAGQVTTAQAGGNALIDRLVAAGMTFQVLEDDH